MKENPAALSHHRCGFQTYRAVIALLAITGSFDVSGGQLPIKPTFNHVSAGFTTREKEFSDGLFPLWYAVRNGNAKMIKAIHVIYQNNTTLILSKLIPLMF